MDGMMIGIMKQYHLQFGSFFMFIKNRKRLISELCEDSLRTKWHAESMKHVSDKCPFCDDALIRTRHFSFKCDYCICPESICNSSGNTLIEKMKTKYGDIYSNLLVHELEEEDLAMFINEFKKYIIV